VTSDKFTVLAHRGAPELLAWLEGAIAGTGPVEVVSLEGDLEKVLARPRPPDLVIASTAVSLPSSIATLAVARAAGVTVPFIIVAAFANDRIRAFVSGGRERLFEHRMLSARELGELVRQLTGASQPARRCGREGGLGPW
jgi:hypothetical protein